jgi:hypothetical protein
MEANDLSNSVKEEFGDRFGLDSEDDLDDDYEDEEDDDASDGDIDESDANLKRKCDQVTSFICLFLYI